MPSDTALALAAAQAAGRLLLDRRAALTSGVAPAGVQISADVLSDRLIASMLQRDRPADAILSEELAGVGDRTATDRVWIVDPLDGTREYGEAGRSDWAVHVALWVRGRSDGERLDGEQVDGERVDGELVEGVVALPGAGEVWSTDGEPAAPVSRPVRRIVVSRTRPPAWALAVAAELDAEVIGMGSAGAKTAAVLRADADAYLHDGGQYEWDSAAPVAVARHHGLHASRADGGRLRYNQADTYLPDLVICPSGQAGDLLERIARHRSPVTTGSA